MAIDVPDAFRSFLRTESERACDTALNDARATSLKAYNGDAYGDEEEGRSQAVTRDVSEVVDFMGVGILGTILAGGKAVEFDTEPEDVPQIGPDGQPVMQPQAPPQPGQPPQQPQPVMTKVDYGAEATAAVHYQFMRKQKGYRILHDASKAGLLEKTGVVKTYVEPRKAMQQTVTVIGAAVDLQTQTFEGYRIVDAEPAPSEDPETIMTMPAAAQWQVTYEVPQAPLVRDVNVPNEWFMISPDAIDLDDAQYVGDKLPVSISQLVAMGYDYDELLTLWDNPSPDSIVENARDADRSNSRDTVGSRQGPNRLLWLMQEYPLYDLNDDGIAERLFVHRIGQTVLNIMEVDEQPYSGWSPMPMQHRFVGQSIADKTMDIQRIRSVLMRQALDSLYQTTSPRMTVDVSSMTEDTIDDLLTVRPGAIIRHKGTVPAPLPTSDSSQVSFNAMEMMSAERESRTGVTRQSQGLNPDTLNKTASGMAMLQANGDQIELFVTRNFAEMLVGPMFAKRYRLMRQHQAPFRMKIDGKYTQVDPSKWPEEPDMQINVGLGTGSRDQRIAYRREVIGMQSAAVQAGSRIVDEEKLWNSAKAFIDDTSLGVASDYFNDPATLGPPPPAPPNPEDAKNQAQAQLQAQKQDNEHQQAMSRIAINQSESQSKLELMHATNAAEISAREQKAALELQLARDKAAEELRLAEQNFQAQNDLAERKFAFEQEMARKKASVAVDDGSDTITKLREGGNLDQ